MPSEPADALEIRPVTPEDKAAMAEAFERLGPESRYRRFLAPHGQLTASELRYFTEVDHYDHEALVATEPASGAGIGVARYIRSHENPTVAEIAVAVVDEWQCHGVGGRLLATLAERAHEAGITSFSAVMMADNARMRGLLEDIGRVHVVHTERGLVEVVVDLPERGVERLRRLFAAVARGELVPWPARLGLIRAEPGS